MFPVLWMYAPCLQKINNIDKEQEIPGKTSGIFLWQRALSLPKFGINFPKNIKTRIKIVKTFLTKDQSISAKMSRDYFKRSERNLRKSGLF